MSLENDIRELKEAIVELTKAVARDSMIRTEIWNDSTRKALEVFPLSETELRELAAQSAPDPEPPAEDAPRPPKRVAITPEETMELARKVLAAGYRERMKGFLKDELDAATVAELDEPQRIRFVEFACDLLEEAGLQEDAA